MKRPDIATTELLKRSTKILVSLDSDREGLAQADWWKNQFTNSESWFLPPGWGKDPGQAVQNGHYHELRDWVSAGVGIIKEEPERQDHKLDTSDDGLWKKRVYLEVLEKEVIMVADGKTVTIDGTSYSAEEIKLLKARRCSSDELKKIHEVKSLVDGRILG